MSTKGATNGRRWVDRPPVTAQHLSDPWAADDTNHSIHIRLVNAALKALGHSRFPVLPIEYQR